ncbi:MAG: tRNA (adenosine(37)-N6)-threonylcarbamoyltransferase complex transferase subunit TsaD [bacterium]
MVHHKKYFYPKIMKVLGIETSCDETSVAILANGKLLTNLISSQEFHSEFGGVVPELSSRAHLQLLVPMIRQALKETNLKLSDINLVCPTAGPGLIGALLVGLTLGKGLAYSLKIPFVQVNHIEGHIYSGFLMEEKPEFPYLCLAVSGGHTLLLIVKNESEIVKLGSTIDDAAGEAFDKVSKLLGLGYPGGPQIQNAASKGDSKKISFPIANTKNEFDFSFSGLKTAVLRYVQLNYGSADKIPIENIYDIAASFQKAAVDALLARVKKVINNYEIKSLSLVGGVAANKLLRDSFTELSQKYKKKLVIPDLKFCGDNAAMIALRGLMIHQKGKTFGFNTTAYASLPPDTFKLPEEY